MCKFSPCGSKPLKQGTRNFALVDGGISFIIGFMYVFVLEGFMKTVHNHTDYDSLTKEERNTGILQSWFLIAFYFAQVGLAVGLYWAAGQTKLKKKYLGTIGWTVFTVVLWIVAVVYLFRSSWSWTSFAALMYVLFKFYGVVVVITFIWSMCQTEK